MPSVVGSPAHWPRVSVVIPTFNRATLVPDAIASVLSQGYPDLEIVVVDDGSTDNTEKVLAAFGPMVNYVRQENGGPARARNTGIAHATGELLAFLDSDDLYLPGKLHEQVQYFRQRPATVLVYSWFRIVDSRGRTRLGRRCRLTGSVYRDLLLQCMQGPIYPSTVMARRQTLVDVGGLDETMPLSDDTDLFCRVARRGPIGLIPEVLVLLRRLGDNVSRGPGRSKYLAVTRRILDKAFAADPTLDWPLKVRLHAKAQLWSWLVAVGGQLPAGVSFWLRALLTNPREIVHDLRLGQRSRDVERLYRVSKAAEQRSAA
ncbi:MAG: glycosyltransferase family 2 protein [Planctomycetaceae bacterium]